MKRSSVLRALRIAAISFFVVAAVVTTVFWVRSYRYAERIHGWLSDQRCFVVASKQGRILAMSFPPAFHPAFWRWEIRRYPVKHRYSLPNEWQRKLWDSRFGFGIIHSYIYSLEQLWAPPRVAIGSPIPIASDAPPSSAPRVIVSFANFVTFRGTGLIVPYWFLVSLFTANAIVLSLNRPWQFSLRRLFVFVTVVAVLLGLVAAIDN